MGRPRKTPEVVPALYTPKETFHGPNHEGVPMTFQVDHTIVEEGHRILEMYPHLFKRVHVHYPADRSVDVVEQATAAPGEVRG